MPDNNDYIELFGARENNLKCIDVMLPKNKFVVVTGASGSGKSTLVVNTLYRECQRQFMNCAGIHDQLGSRPKVDRVRGLLPAVCVGQLQTSFNPRSTVGTFTNAFNILRMLYCEYGIRTCTSCGKQFSSYDWKDSEVKKSDHPDVCPVCRQSHSKRTVQHFSFNRVEGACPTCHGLGRVNSVSLQRLLNPDKGLVTGAIKPWRHLDDGLWASDCLVNAAKYYGFSFDNTMPIKDYPEPLKLLLLYGVCDPRFIAYYPEKRPASRRSEGHYEGIVNIFMRRYQENEDNPKYRERMEQFMDQEVCPDCSGSRLNEEARNVRLMDKNLADLGGFSLYTLFQWLTEVQQHMKELGSTFASAWQLANELNQQLHHFVELGVGYLSLIRPMTASWI